MKPFLVETGQPRASTCVLAGRIAPDHVPDLVRFRHLLWFVDAAGRLAIPPALEQSAVVVEPASVEHTTPGEVAGLLERLLERDLRELPAVRITPDVREHCVADYVQLVGQIHAAFESAQRARVNRQADAFLCQKHLLLNFSAYAGARVPDAWAGALRGFPAFVCGAGPSLDVSAEVLAPVADSGIVFAADSALRVLARRGIQADFAVSIHAQRTPEKCLAADVAPSRVVLATISPPAWRDALPEDRSVFISGGQITEEWLRAHGVAPTAVTAMESCGSSALELARFFGCAPIHLFGLDLATSDEAAAPRRALDADPSIYGDPAGFAAPLPRVPGNHAAEVPTPVLADWHALDRRLADWPAGLVINVNDRGARLRNTTVVHPDQFHAPKAAASKRQSLGRLPQPAIPDGPAMRAARAELGSFGARGCRAVAAARAQVESGNLAGAAAGLRALYADEDFARAFGAFSTKAMPQLLAPQEAGEEAFRTLLDEFEELACLAEAVYEMPAD